MKEILKKVLKDKFLLTVIGLFIIGFILRIYNLGEFVTFLGDQGRDATIIRRIVTFEHFPAIGAPMSIGGVYLGPFYYYFIAPWLLLFNFNPIGLAFGVVFFSSLYIIANYFIVKEFFDQKIALISTIIVTFSSTLIEFSRFSWNPNLLPVFALIFAYFFIQALDKRRYTDFIVAGAFIAFMIQLHYLALLLGVPIVICIIIEFFRHKNKIKSLILGVLSMSASFVVFSLPLIVFDLRHNFLNANNFISLIKNNESQSSSMIQSFLNTIQDANEYIVKVDLPFFVHILLFIGIVVVGVVLRNKLKQFYFILITISLMAAMSLYGGERHPHYYGTILPFYIVSFSILIAFLFKKKIGMIVGVILLALFVYFNSTNYYFLYSPPNNQIDHAKKVAKIIYDNSRKEKISVTAIPLNYIALPPRYFLEVWGKRPTEQDSIEKSDELFVICEQKCHPIGDPQWDIAFFAPNKIVGTWKVDNVTIYKLIR